VKKTIKIINKQELDTLAQALVVLIKTNVCVYNSKIVSKLMDKLHMAGAEVERYGW